MDAIASSAWLLTAGWLAEEKYQEVQRVITERYDQLEKAREVTEPQAAQLKVAHRSASLFPARY